MAKSDFWYQSTSALLSVSFKSVIQLETRVCVPKRKFTGLINFGNLKSVYLP